MIASGCSNEKKFATTWIKRMRRKLRHGFRSYSIAVFIVMRGMVHPGEKVGGGPILAMTRST